MKTLAAFTIIVITFLTACAPIIPASGGEPTPIVITAEVSTAVSSSGPVNPFGTQNNTPVSYPTPVPPTALPALPNSNLSLTELKYKVLDQFPDFFYCDPDLYPVARGDAGDLAQQKFPQIQADQAVFQAILTHHKLSGTSFTPAQMQLIYSDYKKLEALYFDLAGDKYQFLVLTGTDIKKGLSIKGTIDGQGVIVVQDQQPGYLNCPICLAAGTLIDTPQGAVSVENLKVGEQVWTKNEAGRRVIGVILETGSVRVPVAHQIIHLILSDGRELWASPGHPTADGRRLADIKAGDMLDGAHVISAERMPYGGSATYDLLPSGGTGFYWADGILMGSTLK